MRPPHRLLTFYFFRSQGVWGAFFLAFPYHFRPPWPLLQLLLALLSVPILTRAPIFAIFAGLVATAPRGFLARHVADGDGAADCYDQHEGDDHHEEDDDDHLVLDVDFMLTRKYK